MKVAILHYWFVSKRGGEKVVESILKLYPDADIYTLFYNKDIYGSFPNNKIYSSVLNIPILRRFHHLVFPLYPLGVKSLKLKKDYDLIISSESGPIKGVSIPDNVPHICYIHSPMRYCWDLMDDYLNSVSKLLRPLLKYFFLRLRKWDIKTIDNVDLYIANSNNVAKRVLKYYKRESLVIYPPISNDLFKRPLIIENTKEYYLSFGAITPYKKIDLLIKTFNENKQKLIIIGEGTEKKKLMKIAKPNIKFLGKLSWNQIEHYLYKTKVLVFPGEEDFGMIPLEVMSYGIPVLAFKKGGALETVIENKEMIGESSGLFFEKQTIKSLQEGLIEFSRIEHLFNPLWIKNHAYKFREEVFLSKFKKEVTKFINT